MAGLVAMACHSWRMTEAVDNAVGGQGDGAMCIRDSGQGKETRAQQEGYHHCDDVSSAADVWDAEQVRQQSQQE